MHAPLSQGNELVLVAYASTESARRSRREPSHAPGLGRRQRRGTWLVGRGLRAAAVDRRGKARGGLHVNALQRFPRQVDGD